MFFSCFILTDEFFAKALRILVICLLVNNNSCRKLTSSLELPIKFNDRVTSS